MPDVSSLLENIFFIIFPFLFAVWVIHRFKTSWKVFWIGVLICIFAGIINIAALFGLSAAVNIGKLPYSPTTILLISALITSPLSAIFMEGMRWVGFQWAKAGGKPYGASLTLAAGSGSIDMIGGGLGTFLIWGTSFLNGRTIWLPIINYNLQTSVSLQPLVQSIIAGILINLNAILENLAPMTLHIALSVMVWMAISQRKALWFAAALLWHMLSFGINVYFIGSGFFTWTMEKPNHPNGEVAIVMSISIVLNLIFIIWSYNKAKANKRRATSLPRWIQLSKRLQNKCRSLPSA